MIFDPVGGPDVVRRLCAAHRSIRHRGPDGEGVLLLSADGVARRFDNFETVPSDAAATLGLAFRRLRILDLTEAAAQPMASADGAIWLVFNGEIYNFAELRTELAAGGYSFRSTGDTEVILAAYQRWGTDCFDRLDGMWAIVILDLVNRKLVGSRDRFGIKPLYWSTAGDRLLLASEAKQIVAALGGRPRANQALVTKYLQGARLPNLYETFFEGIHAVPAAHWFEAPLGERPATPTFHCYWQLPPSSTIHTPLPSLPYSEAIDEIEDALQHAVATHSVADVRVGSLLSGGLDSSIVTAMFARQRPDPRFEKPTFSFGFRDGFADVSELPYSDAVARATGLPNFDVGFDAKWILEHIDRVVQVMEEPSLAPAALAQHRIFELCRAHDVTVVLDGQGADEIFGGYLYHERLFVLDRLHRHRWKEALSELNAISVRDGRSEAALVIEYLGIWFKSKVRRHLRTHPWLANVEARQADLQAYADRGFDPSAFYRQIYWDIKWGNVRLILDYADKNAMSWSVEARVPYFDRRLVELAMSLPDTYKVFAGERKRVLRDVGRRFLPPEVTERKTRMGFAVPTESFVSQLWPVMREEITDPSFSRLPVFEQTAFSRLIREFDRGIERDHSTIWRLWALARWNRACDATF